jgi:homoserine kinase
MALDDRIIVSDAMQLTSVKVNSPATTANLGPGYDCLGMALDIWNTVEIRSTRRAATRVVVNGMGNGELPEDETNLVCRSMAKVWRRTGYDAPPLEIICDNQIPLKRGLGSSSAAIVGGMVAANLALGKPLSDAALLKMVVEMEGHPDNVAPALLGGLRIVGVEEGLPFTVPISVPAGLMAVLFVPEVTISTLDARAVLPSRVSREDAVHNIARVAMLVNALNAGRMNDLDYATRDLLHQPYRQKLFPAMKLIFSGAMDGGALGVFMSGSGPTVLALAQSREMTIAYEMKEAARKAGVDGTVKVTRPTSKGTHQA